VIIAERMWSVRRHGPLAMLLAGTVIPEWIYEQFRAWVYWSALWKTIRGSDTTWINN